MVCSACGHESQPGMRFCGMCGMPLPHRPLTTPGAQSTIGLTRVPVDNRAEPLDRGMATVTSTRADAVAEPPQQPASLRAEEGLAATAEQPADGIDEAPPKELVPDVPLHEYIQNFHYTPPSDTAEITMRGEIPALDPEIASSESTAAEEPSVVEVQPVGDLPEPGDAPAMPANEDGGVQPPSNISSEQTPSAPAELSAVTPSVAPPAEETATAPLAADPPESLMIRLGLDRPSAAKPVAKAEEGDSVVKRLGLEPETAAEGKVTRPRFLDVNEVPRESKPSSGTSTIVGPSFLGLSDAPDLGSEEVLPDDEAAPRRTWPLWVAAGIVLVVAGLGVAQWRAQKNQSGDGPLDAIKDKVQDLRNGGSQPATNETPPAIASSDTATKPEVTVQGQPAPPSKPDNLPPAGNTTEPSPATGKVGVPPTLANSAVGSPNGTAGKQKSLTPTPTSPLKSNNAADSSPSTSTASVGAAKALPKAAGGDSAVAAPKPEVPGVDEMTKAKNASDAAATAAWLWKATAKGNPDAPVQLADMYIAGNGVPRSCEQAMVLLKTAAAKENARARNRLGAMYQAGNCVGKNRVEAYRWVSSALAANPNSQWAQQNRDTIWQQMTPDERAQAAKYR